MGGHVEGALEPGDDLADGHQDAGQGAAGNQAAGHEHGGAGVGLLGTELADAIDRAARDFLEVLLNAPEYYGEIAAEFDANKPIKFKGTVTKMLWVNPHAWIYVDVKNADGTVEEWMIETGTPNTLIRRGLTKESLPKGTEIIVDGYQSKDGSRRANGRDLTLPNGQTLFLGSSGTGAPYEKK